MDKTKDFYGNELPTLWDSDLLTVGELKKQLENYSDDTLIYMEASNAYNKNDTLWAQRAIGTYPCTKYDTKEKSLMIVGTIR